jgi:hypothetical protein
MRLNTSKIMRVELKAKTGNQFYMYLAVISRALLPRVDY